MSAFMVDDATYRAIANTLISPAPVRRNPEPSWLSMLLPQGGDRIPLDNEGEARLAANIMRQLYAANYRAVNGRYGDSVRHGAYAIARTPPLIHPRWSRTPELTPVQLFKHLQCLRYQCSEDVPAWEEEAHASALALLDDMIAKVAKITVESLPAYDAAEWG